MVGGKYVLNQYFVDMHVHIGQTEDGAIVKMAASKKLTLENIAEECLERKGINIVGIVDALSPKVWEDWEKLIANGDMYELSEGGLCYKDHLTVLLGCEIETVEENGGTAHLLVYFSHRKMINNFAEKISPYIKNINYSTQRCKLNAQKLWELADHCGGILIPAHIFTPYKSLYGKCTDSLKKVFSKQALSKISAVELGLSADSDIGDRISELASFSFLSNSDAHSLSKIGREYNVMELAKPNYSEVVMALKNKQGRKITANFGLNPKLGKYHRTFCRVCGYTANNTLVTHFCPDCGSNKLIKGVLDRVTEMTNNHKAKHPIFRPPYLYQVPLEFVPKVGKQTLNKLIRAFGNEMMVLHMATYEQLAEVVGEKIAYNIDLARRGKMELKSGGGGKYGKFIT